jgi:DNA-directed RNA polymerase specialized sigma24 family protein
MVTSQQSKTPGWTEMVGELATLIGESSAAQGVDFWAVESAGISASEWADMTDRGRSTVARNVRRARDAVSED